MGDALAGDVGMGEAGAGGVIDLVGGGDMDDAVSRGTTRGDGGAMGVGQI